MTDLTVALRSELESLEAELAADPRYRKLEKIRELLAIYNSASRLESQHVVAVSIPAPMSASIESTTKADRVRTETMEFIERSGGVAHRRDILDHLIQAGIMGKERSPIASFAAYLSEMNEFMSAGGGKWRLRTESGAAAIPRRKIVRQHIPGSASAQVVEFAVRYLREKGTRAPAPEIIEAMRVQGQGADMKMDAVSSSLSHSALFDNVRGQGYGLVEWRQSSETETPDSGELSGAPRTNGALPLSL